MLPSNRRRIVCVPGHASRILEIDVDDGSVRLRDEEFSGKYKWLRAVVLGDWAYFIPCHAERVLKVNETSAVEIGPRLPGQWKWHGGVVASDGRVYCIPQSAERVLRIDGDVVEEVGPNFPGKWKWYGGLRSGDRVYGIPSCASGVLAIDTGSDEPRVFTIECPAHGGWKWHGGVVAPDGSVWGVPANSDRVLKVHNDTVSLHGHCRSGQHRDDDKYKYLGAVVGNDGCVYCIPSDADFILKIDPTSGDVRDFGPDLSFMSRGASRGQNKWQNAVLLGDGAIYCIPLKAESVLRIDTERQAADLLPHGADGKNLWEGAVLGDDGALYCMPLNCNRVLKIQV